jgi:hypothetical protein
MSNARWIKGEIENEGISRVETAKYLGINLEMDLNLIRKMTINSIRQNLYLFNG